MQLVLRTNLLKPSQEIGLTLVQRLILIDPGQGNAPIGFDSETHLAAGADAERFAHILGHGHLRLRRETRFIRHRMVLRGAGNTVNHHHCSGRAANPARCSIARAAFSTPCSSNGLPIGCRPSGGPWGSSPAGTDIAGSPARLAGTENTSLRYIASGSFSLSPRANAADGAVGAR